MLHDAPALTLNFTSVCIITRPQICPKRELKISAMFHWRNDEDVRELAEDLDNWYGMSFMWLHVEISSILVPESPPVGVQYIDVEPPSVPRPPHFIGHVNLATVAVVPLR